MVSTEVNTAVVDNDEDMGLTSEVLAQAYPTFFGPLVRYKEYPPKDPTVEHPRYRAVYEIKPYDIEVNSERGTIVGTIFFAKGDHKKSWTEIHQFMMGFKDQGILEGRPPRAVGKEFWWKTNPGRNGFRGNTFPVRAPKDAITPPPPPDWDFDAWVEQFGEGTETESANVSSEALLPESLWSRLVSIADGKLQGSPAIARTALHEDDFAAYDPPTLSRTLEHLVNVGILGLEDGRYSGPVVVDSDTSGI